MGGEDGEETNRAVEEEESGEEIKFSNCKNKKNKSKEEEEP